MPRSAWSASPTRRRSSPATCTPTTSHHAGRRGRAVAQGPEAARRPDARGRRHPARGSGGGDQVAARGRQAQGLRKQATGERRRRGRRAGLCRAAGSRRSSPARRRSTSSCSPHASCRKPHGVGHPALQNLDAYIDDLDGAADGQAAHALPDRRPDLRRRRRVGAAARRQRAGDRSCSATRRAGAVAARRRRPCSSTRRCCPPGFRQRITGSAGFTSDWASSHLIGFGEYLAMYCVAWNPALWPVLAVADAQRSGPSADAEDAPG